MKLPNPMAKRDMKAISTSMAMLCARLLSVAAMLVTNGVAARRMSGEEFGLWTLLIGLNLLTNGLDMGLTQALGIRLAALGSRGAEAEEERRETFLAILLVEVGITLALILAVVVLFPYIPWERWWKISSPTLVAEVRHLMPLWMVFMVSTLPFALMNAVFFAYQEIKLASGIIAVTALAQMGFFVVSAYCVRFTAVVLIYFVANVGLGVVVTVYVFARRRWRVTVPRMERVAGIVRSMARTGFYAFLLGLPAIIQGILGTFLSGFISGLTAAGDFTLLQKPFAFLNTAHLSILSPVSPALTLEAHSGQWDKVRRRLRVCVAQLFPAFFLLAGGAILIGHPLLIRVWAGRAVRDYPLASLLLVWCCLAGFVNTFSVFLNGLGQLKVQAILALTMLVPSIILPVLLSRWFGTLAIGISYVLCLIPAAIVLPIYTRRALRLELARA